MMRRVALLFLACCSRPQELVSDAAHVLLESGASPSAPAGPSELAWDVPGKWSIAPNTSAIRKATYRIPAAAGDPEDTQLTVTTAGGTVDANIERWKGQFKYPGLKRSNMDSTRAKVP